jgi:hypothetical protein
MTEFLICAAIIAVVAAFLYRLLLKSNMDIPETAEVAVSEEEAEVYVTRFDEVK